MAGRITGTFGLNTDSAGMASARWEGSLFTGAQPNKQMSKINNLNEFLQWRGFGKDEIYYWARCFYKYTACGPWVVFLMRDGEEIYYEDIGPVYAWQEERCHCTYQEMPEADDPQGFYYSSVDPDPDCEDCQGAGTLKKWRKTGRVIEVDPDKCVGIRFGSIVEGSDVCSGPFDFMFPFESKEFEECEEYMEAETSFYWERDNYSWYRIYSETCDDEYFARYTWDGVEMETYPEDTKLKETIEKFITDNFDDIPREDWMTAAKSTPPIPIPGTDYLIYEYINDCDF